MNHKKKKPSEKPEKGKAGGDFLKKESGATAGGRLTSPALVEKDKRDAIEERSPSKEPHRGKGGPNLCGTGT